LEQGKYIGSHKGAKIVKAIRSTLFALLAGLTMLTQPIHFESFAQEGALKPQADPSITRDPTSDSLTVTKKNQGDSSEMPQYKAPPLREALPFKAPLRGAPGGRLSGGTRGVESKMLYFALLAPSHTGLTLSEQPTLYWFSSASANCPVELTILMGKEMKSILRVRIADEVRAGFHPIPLADYGIRLQTGVGYQCFVSMLTEPKHASRDIIAGGAIERVAYPNNFQKKLTETDIKQVPHVYAAEGIWYDAMNALCSRIDADPSDSLLREQRISLLQQGGLTEAADYETEHGVPVLHQ
jgi:hypothetical protein